MGMGWVWELKSNSHAGPRQFCQKFPGPIISANISDNARITTSQGNPNFLGINLATLLQIRHLLIAQLPQSCTTGLIVSQSTCQTCHNGVSYRHLLNHLEYICYSTIVDHYMSGLSFTQAARCTMVNDEDKTYKIG